ncbi:heavy-metal-associated domain-containing protein [Mesorhizobium atlanticum]
MTCAHCPPAVEKAIRAVKGVRAASVNLATQTAKVDYDPGQAKVADILRAIRSVGYAAGTATMRIPIKNMHCTSCAIGVELALDMTRA